MGEGKGNFIQNTDGTYTNVGDGNGDYVVFPMGNNMGFSMMSQSNGCQILGSFAQDTDQICYHTLANLAFTS